MTTIEERLVAGIGPSNSCCWVWTKGTDSSGYGKMKVNGRIVSTHKLAYTIWVGIIPAGWQVDHLCRNILCLNPLHLEAVPRAINRLRQPLKTHCKNGHEFTDENTYIRNEAKGIRRQCKVCILERGKSARQSRRTSSIA